MGSTVHDSGRIPYSHLREYGNGNTEKFERFLVCIKSSLAELRKLIDENLNWLLRNKSSKP